MIFFNSDNQFVSFTVLAEIFWFYKLSSKFAEYMKDKRPIGLGSINILE